MHLNWKQLKPVITLISPCSSRYLAMLDEKGNILMANARMKKKFNLEDPRQVKMNFFNLLYPSHFESFRNAFHFSMKNNNPYSVELLLKNGSYHLMNWNVMYWPYAGKSSRTFLCTGFVTDSSVFIKKRTATESFTNENMLMAFLNNSPNLLWAVDEEARLVFANNVFLQYFRLDKTAINRKIIDLLPLKVADALYEKHLAVFQTSLPVEFSQTAKNADGSPASFQVKIFPVENRGNKKIAGGIACNFFAESQAERKLKMATERIEQLQRITSDAIWEWDMRTGDIFRNVKLVEMTGYLPEDHRGLSWWLSRVHPEDRDILNDTLKKVTDQNLQSWQSEYRFLCADGEYKNMLDRGFVIYDSGMPVKMIGSLSDITNEKLMENLLTEEKINQYRTVSEAAMRVQEQERTRLAREMHDNVNQLLSTIKLFAGMLTVPEEEKDVKAKITEYTLLAIEEIRKLSREMVAPQLDGGSLAEHIRKIIDDLELSTQLKIKFTHDAENELLGPGKKMTLFRIAQEQLKNIVKYSQAKKVEILLQCNDGSVQLIIYDNGIGFDVKKTNSGIGLSSISDRARFYNGNAEITSSPGKGCRLVVTIPING